MDRRLLKITILSALGCVGLFVLLYFFIDRPVDLAARGLKGGPVYQAATALSLLADHDLFNVLLTIGFVFLGVRVLAGGLTPGLRSLLYICLAVTITMMIGETVKWFLGRYRPVMLFEHGLYGFSFLASSGNAHSFPSGHNFRIFSALTALGLVWPKARWWLLSLAGLVGISRVLVTRHYPSDVLAGAFLGVFCALWVWRIMRAEPVAQA